MFFRLSLGFTLQFPVPELTLPLAHRIHSPLFYLFNKTLFSLFCSRARNAAINPTPLQCKNSSKCKE